MMKLLARLAVLASLGWLVLVLFWETRDHAAETDDASGLVVLFAATLLLGAIIGTGIAMWLLPMIGEWIGNYFFSPSERGVVNEPHAEAAAKMARGDYAGALADYRAACARDPADTFALGNAARILCEKLGDPASAASLLEDALSRDWPQDQSAFLANRLADVYWKYQADAPRARSLLLQIIAAMPGTRHAAQAQKRLREIDDVPARGELPALGEGEDATAQNER